MLVHNKGRFIRHFGSVRLIPGVNQITDEAAKELSKELEKPLNKALVDSREIVLPEGKSKNTSNQITELNANDAIGLVQDTFDKELLEKFLEDEEASSKKRVSVVKAIQEQIETEFNPSDEKIVNID